MALRINTTNAILNYDISKATLSIKQPQAQIEGETKLPKVIINKTLPKITIDQTQPFNESGLKTISAFSAEAVNYAKSMMESSKARIAGQGDELTNIHLDGNPIADQALYNAFDQFYGEFGMVTMPKSKPNIQVQEGTLDIRLESGSIDKNVKPRKPEIEYNKGGVRYYLKQKNSISIKYIGENIDYKL